MLSHIQNKEHPTANLGPKWGRIDGGEKDELDGVLSALSPGMRSLHEVLIYDPADYDVADVHVALLKPFFQSHALDLGMNNSVNLLPDESGKPRIIFGFEKPEDERTSLFVMSAIDSINRQLTAVGATKLIAANKL